VKPCKVYTWFGNKGNQPGDGLSCASCARGIPYILYIKSSGSNRTWDPLHGFGEKVGALGIQQTHVYGPEVGWLGLLLNFAFAASLWFWISKRRNLQENE
jgi:hypothetical protein